MIMPEIKKKLELSESQYYYTHLSFINCILPTENRMMDKEMEVLAAFMSLNGDLSSHRFGRSGKKIVKEKLNLSDSSLSNYIGTSGSLFRKRLILRTGDIITIAPILFPEKDQQVYMFKIVNTNLNTTTNE